MEFYFSLFNSCGSLAVVVVGFVGRGGGGFYGFCWWRWCWVWWWCWVLLAEVVVVGWVVFGLAVVAVDYVGNLVGCGFYVWW